MDIQALKDTFEFFDDWEDKYRFVIDLGKDLPTLETSQRVDENIIRGCQSQVWLVHELRDNTLHFAMDSDAHIVRGLISIVLIALNDRSPAEILPRACAKTMLRQRPPCAMGIAVPHHLTRR